MYKRWQLTLLIILGIVLVVSAGLIYFYRDQIFLSQWERERAEALVVPEEAEELHQQINTCVEDIAVDAFYVSQNVPLGNLYRAAAEIMETENTEFVLEELSYDALVLYPEDVPLSWAEFSCDQRNWEVEEVENNLKDIL